MNHPKAMHATPIHPIVSFRCRRIDINFDEPFASEIMARVVVVVNRRLHQQSRFVLGRHSDLEKSRLPVGVFAWELHHRPKLIFRMRPSVPTSHPASGLANATAQ